MQTEHLKHMERRFAAYLTGFHDAAGRLPFMLQLKADHSRRVADDMLGLARAIGWDAARIAMAGGLGLVHDIGRFEQYVRFQTFRDADSVDHGVLGASIAAESGVLDECRAPVRDLILLGIRHHNARELPALDTASAQALVWLVRDADKLDIFHVLYESWRAGEFAKRPEILHGVDLNGPPGAEALADLRACRPVSFRHVHSFADFFLMQASWAYDINYPASARRMLERGCISRLMEILPRVSEIKDCVDAAHEHIITLAGKGSA